MNDRSSKLAQFSQIETKSALKRVVLVGASNLSIMFPTVVETACATFNDPLELFIAKGFGRSYGQESEFFGKKFPGILQSDLWSSLGRAPRLPTFAILADVGNDLAYGSSPTTIIGWVETVLDRLAMHDARVVLNNVPLDALRTLPPWRYRVLRRLFFPGSTLAHGEMLGRAETLSEALSRVASERKTPIFSGEISWYGFDPIHPRRSCAGEIWSRMLGALTDSGDAVRLVRPTWRRSLHWRRFRHGDAAPMGAQTAPNGACARHADGSTVGVY